MKKSKLDKMIENICWSNVKEKAISTLKVIGIILLCLILAFITAVLIIILAVKISLDIKSERDNYINKAINEGRFSISTNINIRDGKASTNYEYIIKE